MTTLPFTRFVAIVALVFAAVYALLAAAGFVGTVLNSASRDDIFRLLKGHQTTSRAGDYGAEILRKQEKGKTFDFPDTPPNIYPEDLWTWFFEKRRREKKRGRA